MFHKAFTLLELVVVISIIVMMTALGLPAFQRFGSQQELDQATEQIVSILKEAQATALAPAGGEISYVVVFAPPNQITVNGLTATAATRNIKQVTMPSFISFNENNQWTFAVADQGRLTADRSVTVSHQRLPGIIRTVIGKAASGLITVQ